MARRNNTDAELKTFADGIIHRALMALLDHGVPFDMAMDRLLTTAAAQIAHQQGAAHTADVFRRLAENIDRGALLAVERRTTAN